MAFPSLGDGLDKIKRQRIIIWQKISGFAPKTQSLCCYFPTRFAANSTESLIFHRPISNRPIHSPRHKKHEQREPGGKTSVTLSLLQVGSFGSNPVNGSEKPTHMRYMSPPNSKDVIQTLCFFLKDTGIRCSNSSFTEKNSRPLDQYYWFFLYLSYQYGSAWYYYES